jgi:hypothetical protein
VRGLYAAVGGIVAVGSIATAPAALGPAVDASEPFRASQQATPVSERQCSPTGGPEPTHPEDPQDAEPFCVRENPDDRATQLPFTPPNEILVVSANLLQGRGSEDTCPTSGAAATPGTPEYKRVKGCNAEERERAFADRLRDLAAKMAGEADEMGAIPDVVLLQEMRRDKPADDDVVDLVERINGHFLTPNDVNPADGRPDHADFRVAKSRNAAWIFDRTFRSDGTLDTVTQADGAIIYNHDTLRRLSTSPGDDLTDLDRGHSVDHVFSPRLRVRGDECVDPRTGKPVVRDVDFDGIDECKTRTFRRTYLIGFEEVASARSVVVADAHFVLKKHLDRLDDPAVQDQRERSQTDFHNTKADEWTRQLIDEIQTHYGARASHHVLGGDFNIERCIPARYEPDYERRKAMGIREPEERVDCTHRRWWDTLAAAGYEDAVFTMHGASQPLLDDQYRDANTKRRLRIDLIFASPPPSVADASHDLTCGIPRNCDELVNPERYSDHRFVWGRVDLIR